MQLTSVPTAGLSPGHPTWCDGTDSLLPAGEPFHTVDVAEVDALDADLANVPVSVWVAVQALADRPADIRLNLRPCTGRQHDTGVQLSPQVSIELGRALIIAGILGGRP